MKWSAASITCSVVLLGCSNGALAPAQTPDGVRFEVSELSYAATDTIELVLSNQTESHLGYNLCFAVLERRKGGNWERVERSPPDEGDCTTVQFILDPGQSVTARQAVEAWMEAGVYRFRHDVQLLPPREDVTLTSNEFRIVQ